MSRRYGNARRPQILLICPTKAFQGKRQQRTSYRVTLDVVKDDDEWYIEAGVLVIEVSLQKMMHLFD